MNGEAFARPTSRAEILERIAELAREKLGRDEPLDEKMRLVEGLGLDSIRVLTLVVEIEDRFRVCLDDDVDRQIETVGDLVDALEKQLASATANAE
jgi:acyl carrier protein